MSPINIRRVVPIAPASVQYADEQADKRADKQRSGFCASINNWFKYGVATLRQMTGDDAYERYVAHQRQHHADGVVMDRRAYYLDEQQRKWTGVKRCC